MAKITRKETDVLYPRCKTAMEEVTTLFENPFPEDNEDWTLVTHDCSNCGLRKKIFCSNPELVGIEKSPWEEFKEQVERRYGTKIS